MYLRKEEIYKIILPVSEAYVRKWSKRQGMELALTFSFPVHMFSTGLEFYTYHYDENWYFKS